jgi:hypothetical protein
MIVRALLLLLAFALLALLAAAAVAGRMAAPIGDVYTVAQVKAGMAAHPAAWVGRTVLVRAIAYPRSGSSCPNANPYCDAVSLLDNATTATDASTLVVSGRPADVGWTVLRRVPVLGPLIVPPRDPLWGQVATYRVQFVAHPYSACTLPCMGTRLVGIGG